MSSQHDQVSDSAPGSMRSEEGWLKKITLEQRQEVWRKVLEDRAAQEALELLEKHGFGIAHLIPEDPTFRHPNWSDYIAAIPFLPNRPSRRRIHRKISLQKHWPLVRALRRFAQKVDDPFCVVTIVTSRACNLGDRQNRAQSLLK